MADFKLTNLAVNMYCPGNVAQLDDAGLPSLMVWIPAFRICDVLNTTDESIHPAFIVNGLQIPGFWYSKYQNVVHNGKAYSLPGEDPYMGISFDAARDRCESKGYGWHMSTAAEWAAIALWCKKNGSLPYGNNDYGKDIRESNIKGVVSGYDSEGHAVRVASGTGPLSWSHDKSMSGIWDMNGNGWEWLGGLRLVWGELQIFANNDAADPDNPQNTASTCWKAINAADGTLVEPECTVSDSGVKSSGKTVKLDYINDIWTYSTGITNGTNLNKSCRFGAVACTASISNAAKLLLRVLALMPDEGESDADYDNDSMYCTNGVAERCVMRGGTAASNTSGGVFCLYASWPRAISSDNLGFRAAYIPNI